LVASQATTVSTGRFTSTSSRKSSADSSRGEPRRGDSAARA
jgi:hypothetical protein